MQCVNIDIVDDTRVEGEHVFTVEIASVSPPPVVVQCNPTSITVHIVDDDGKSNIIHHCMSYPPVWLVYSYCGQTDSTARNCTRRRAVEGVCGNEWCRLY